MFASILLLIVSGNVSEDRLPEISLSFSIVRPVIVRDSMNLQAKPKFVALADMNKIGKTKIADKPNPDLLISW
jgi:hypothetical protein